MDMFVPRVLFLSTFACGLNAEFDEFDDSIEAGNLFPSHEDMMNIGIKYTIGTVIVLALAMAISGSCWNWIQKSRKKDKGRKKDEDTIIDIHEEPHPSESIPPTSVHVESQTNVKQKSTEPVRGIQNIGNTCYFNSTMQALVHTNCVFREELQNLQKKDEFVLEVQKFFNDMQPADPRPYSPDDLHRLFGKKSPKFADFRQHDSHECLRNFLDNVRKEERDNSGAVDKRKVLTVVDSVFGGHFITVYICKECETPYHVFEALLDISLPIMIDEKDLAAMKSANASNGKTPSMVKDQTRKSPIKNRKPTKSPKDMKSTAVKNKIELKPNKTEQDTRSDATMQQNPPDQAFKLQSKTETTDKHSTNFNIQPLTSGFQLDASFSSEVCLVQREIVAEDEKLHTLSDIVNVPQLKLENMSQGDMKEKSLESSLPISSLCDRETESKTFAGDENVVESQTASGTEPGLGEVHETKHFGTPEKEHKKAVIPDEEMISINVSGSEKLDRNVQSRCGPIQGEINLAEKSDVANDSSPAQKYSCEPSSPVATEGNNEIDDREWAKSDESGNPTEIRKCNEEREHTSEEQQHKHREDQQRHDTELGQEQHSTDERNIEQHFYNKDSEQLQKHKKQDAEQSSRRIDNQDGDEDHEFEDEMNENIQEKIDNTKTKDGDEDDESKVAGENEANECKEEKGVENKTGIESKKEEENVHKARSKGDDTVENIDVDGEDKDEANECKEDKDVGNKTGIESQKEKEKVDKAQEKGNDKDENLDMEGEVEENEGKEEENVENETGIESQKEKEKVDKARAKGDEKDENIDVEGEDKDEANECKEDKDMENKTEIENKKEEENVDKARAKSEDIDGHNEVKVEVEENEGKDKDVENETKIESKKEEEKVDRAKSKGDEKDENNEMKGEVETNDDNEEEKGVENETDLESKGEEEKGDKTNAKGDDKDENNEVEGKDKYVAHVCKEELDVKNETEIESEEEEEEEEEEDEEEVDRTKAKGNDKYENTEVEGKVEANEGKEEENVENETEIESKKEEESDKTKAKGDDKDENNEVESEYKDETHECKEEKDVDNVTEIESKEDVLFCSKGKNDNELESEDKLDEAAEEAIDDDEQTLRQNQDLEEGESDGEEYGSVSRGSYRQAIDKLMTPLSLSSPYLPLNGKKKHVTIYDCLMYFTRKEHIDKEYLCNVCHREHYEKGGEDILLTSATKQTLIFSPPAILTLHLKRFELKPGGSVKRTDRITYGELLDIAPYCSSQCLRNDPPCQNIWYSLYGVVVHIGSTLKSGHYMAYVKIRGGDAGFKKHLQQKFFDRDLTREQLIKLMQDKHQGETFRQPGTWYRMDDSWVREVSVEKVLNQEAYLLFYERM